MSRKVDKTATKNAKPRRKTGGRVAGTPNKKTTNLRVWVDAFLKHNTAGVQKEFDKLKPEAKLAFLEKLMKFALPSLQSVSLKERAESKAKSLSKSELLEIAKLMIDAKDSE